MKDCLVLPVSVSISVHMASELQIMQGSFLFKPGLHQAVGLSFISPSLISLFRDVSKVFRVKYWTQHLKKPPLFLQSLAKLDCSWKIESLRIRYGIWTSTLLYYNSRPSGYQHINPKNNMREIIWLGNQLHIWTYVLCTLFETFCVVLRTHIFATPSEETDIWKSIGLLPSGFHAFCTLCKFP